MRPSIADDDVPPFRRSPAGLALLVVIAVGGYYLVTEHTAHLFGVLPYLLLLACPLMHVFMHRRHRHGTHPHPESSDDEQPRQ
jgi:hypothetical protein